VHNNVLFYCGPHIINFLKTCQSNGEMWVGAASGVETLEGPCIVTGANVENAAYSVILCAERVAMAAAISLYETSLLARMDQNTWLLFRSHVF
jgi:hypothetical protein